MKENFNAMFILNVLSFFVFLIHIVNYLIVYYRNPLKITGSVDFYEYLEIVLFSALGVFAYFRMSWIRAYFKNEVFLPILGENGQVRGFETKRFVYSKVRTKEKKFIHPVIRVLFIYQNKLLLRNYAEAGTDSFLWDLSITSYLRYGESYEEGILRMYVEMYGSDKCKAKFLLKYDYESEYDIQRVFLHCMYVERPFVADEKKHNLKLWTSGQLIENLNQNAFSEKMEKEIVLLRDLSFPGLFDNVTEKN